MKQAFKLITPPLAAIVVSLIPSPPDLPQNAWYFFAIFVTVVLGLILEALPGSAIGLIGVTAVATLAPWTLFAPAELSAPGFNAPARAIEWALSGIVWLAFSAFMFGTAYDRTGLGRRITLSLVKLMGGRTLFLGYAVMLSDVILVASVQDCQLGRCRLEPRGVEDADASGDIGNTFRWALSYRSRWVVHDDGYGRNARIFT